jgi:hypothetical protein
VFHSGNADVPVVSWEDMVDAIQDLMGESDDRVAANPSAQSIRPRSVTRLNCSNRRQQPSVVVPFNQVERAAFGDVANTLTG